VTAVEAEDHRPRADRPEPAGEVAHLDPLGHQVVGVGVVRQEEARLPPPVLGHPVPGEVDQGDFRLARHPGQPFREPADDLVARGGLVGQERHVLLGERTDLRVHERVPDGDGVGDRERERSDPVEEAVLADPHD
jgi:hypothetical protein